MKIRNYTIPTLAAPTNPRTARQSGEKQERFVVRLNPETGELLAANSPTIPSRKFPHEKT